MRQICTPEQLSWLEANKAMPRKALHAQFNAKFGTDFAYDNLRKICQNRGWLTGNKRPPTEAWHERIGRDGYTRVKLPRDQWPAGSDRGYVLKHRLLWERANGPIPDDMRLKCLGDRSNADPSNWTLVPAGIFRRLDRYGKFEQMSAELQPAIIATAKVRHRVEAIRREAA